MNRARAVLLATAVLAALTIGGAWALRVGPFGSGSRDPVIATVDGDPIHLSEARSRVLGLTTMHGNLLDTMGGGWHDEVLRSLVDDRILWHEGEDRGLIPTKQQIASEVLRLQRMFPDLPAYDSWLASQGIDQDELERRVELELLATRVYEAVTADVTVSPARLRDYFEGHRAEFTDANGVPETFVQAHQAVEQKLTQAAKDRAYAGWRDRARAAAHVVVLMDDWWKVVERSLPDGTQG